MRNALFVGAAVGFALVCALASSAVARNPAQAGQQGQSQQQVQQQGQQPPTQQGQAQQGQQGPPAAGGPTGGQGPIIIPKKAPQAPQPPPPPPTTEHPQYKFSVNVPEVQLPVMVQTKDGQFIGHLTKANFRVTEDGVPQTIDKVAYNTDAPMTAVMLVEFRNQFWPFIYQILEASYSFTQQLQPQDWVALVTYDLKPTIVVDFTHNKQAVQAGLQQLGFPGFSEANLYDSLSDVIDRLNGVTGHKVIVLVSDGLDTFSHMTFDQLRKKLAATQNITIFTVSIGWQIREYFESHGAMGGIGEMNFLEADNQMQYFAKVTGGRYYQPRFEGAYPEVFSDITAAVRNQYVISYRSTNPKLDGTFRKVDISVVGPNGEPLKVVNQKGKAVKYEVIAKNGYYAPHAVE